MPTTTLIHALQSGDTSPETIALVIQRLRELQDKHDAVMVGLAGLLVEVAAGRNYTASPFPHPKADA